MRKVMKVVVPLACWGLAACSGESESRSQVQEQSAAPAVAQSRFVRTEEAIAGQYVVVLKEKQAAEGGGVSAASRVSVASVASELGMRHGMAVGRTYEHALRGFVARGSEEQARRLAESPEVAYVIEDGMAYPSNVTWGLDRVDQRPLPLNGSYHATATGAGVNVYVIDSGIRASHADFGGRVSLSYTAVNDGYGAGDCNGHGTHVAATIGGNTWGVAKGARLHSVRVFGCSGGAAWSTVIGAVDWVRANHVKPAVVNMSLGGGAFQALDDALRNAISSGITFVVAAGNSNADACGFSPARTPEAITVGSTNSSDVRSSFSNWGSCVDLFAPGEGITSAWWNSDTATSTISGTSMASPHVAGAAAVYLQSKPSASPAEVANVLLGNATGGVVQNPGAGSPNRLLYARVHEALQLWGAPNDVPAAADFDGDGRTDVAIWRPGDGMWWIIRSSNGSWYTQQWGVQGDVPVAADYDGDGRADIAVWRPSNGTWYIVRSSNGSSYTQQWGVPGDVPAAVDYDGDARADIAVWRPGDGMWWIIRSSNGSWYTQQWGVQGDVPVAADYDGDARADVAVWRPSNGTWYVVRSSNGSSYTQQWGVQGDVPVHADYDGDRRADMAVWRPSNGTWYVIRSSNGSWYNVGWGIAGDRPVPGRYNADLKADMMVWRVFLGQGEWWRLNNVW